MKTVGEIGLELVLGGIGGLAELADRVAKELGPHVLEMAYQNAVDATGEPPDPDVLRLALRTAFMVEEFRR